MTTPPLVWPPSALLTCSTIPSHRRFDTPAAGTIAKAAAPQPRGGPTPPTVSLRSSSTSSAPPLPMERAVDGADEADIFAPDDDHEL